MRLIDADALIRRWCGVKCGCERDECGREIEPCIVVMAIEEAPTVNAEPVVRCKDCKYMTEHCYTDGNAPYWTCSEWDSGTDYDGFCHYAERRTDE